MQIKFKLLSESTQAIKMAPFCRHNLAVGDTAKVTTDYTNSFLLVPLLMTDDLEGHLKVISVYRLSLSLPHPISQKLYQLLPQLLKLFIRNHTRVFK